MARQSGVVKIEGSLDDLTFKKTIDGYQVGLKPRSKKAAFKTGESYARTRENAAEFGRAGTSGKVLRRAVQELSRTAKDQRVISRLVARMMEIIRKDAINSRGERNVYDGPVELLKDFEFNAAAVFGQTVSIHPAVSIDRALGLLEVSIGSFVPANVIKKPQGATHYKLASLGAEVNFQGESYITDVHESAMLPIDQQDSRPLVFSNQVTTNSGHPLFVLLGIQFFQMVNGQQYPLNNGAFNALTILEVSPA
ncbi:MAG TPA: hypothetical protein VHK91_04835 [Flavisolibacter sp.]|jgi:hypothetical protein|nr:hypothetical protein [Flavisolibacter sp.]